MIRKNAISLILTAVVALTMLVALAVPVMNATSNGAAATVQHTSIMLADAAATAPAMFMATNPSGGGNTGG